MDWVKYYTGRLLTGHEVQMIWERHQLSQQIGLDDLKLHLKSIPAILSDGQNFCCQRCHNQDKKQFYFLPGRESVYCLSCLQMGRVTSKNHLYYLEDPDPGCYRLRKTCLTWEGKLSQQQAKASQIAVDSLQDTQHPHLIHAVTGAGKTEMLFQVINCVLIKGGRVGIASPRIDVCLELAPRIRAAFSEVDLCLLYGGSLDDYRANEMVIATTHQLLRFSKAFDLLIVDEVDAFPYVNSESLHHAVTRSVKDHGKLIFLTATPDDTLKKAIESGAVTHTVLPARFHGFPLPEVKMVWLGRWQQAIEEQNINSLLFEHLSRFIKLEGICLIFMANIVHAQNLATWLMEVFPQSNVTAVHARDPKREDKVMAVRRGKIKILITTTILERGVTFENCHVFVLGAEDPLFSRASLVQMAGRVGRKEKFPRGTLIYGHFGISRAMKEAAQEIKQMNELASEWNLLKEVADV